MQSVKIMVKLTCQDFLMHFYIVQSKLDFTYFSVSGGKYVKSGHT